MRTRQVIRIENPEGIGPYHRSENGWPNDLEDDGIDMYARPNRPLFQTPDNIPGRDAYHPDHVFAYPNLTRLLEWWDDPREVDILKRHDYKIVVYEVPPEYCIDCQTGTQLVFHRYYAQPILEMPL